jgi:RecB family endonuclease NucS
MEGGLSVALFAVEQGKVSIIQSKEFVDETALQKLFDDNLEDITGVRLIESQYSIPNGRIDSLGIDEQATPVVIEYKWGSRPLVIFISEKTINNYSAKEST